MIKKWEILSTEKRPVSNDEIISILLKNRGISNLDRDDFLKPSLESITLESVGISIAALKKLLVRLDAALKNKEMIVVYGDYDVDGVTATAILWETLISLGFNVLPYIPHRQDEGYGLSIKGIENIKASTDKQISNVKLIITVDNGIVAHEAVNYAHKQGIDVIVTDHHLSDDEEKLPQALAIIHTVKLCGAGIAWLISKNIRQNFGMKDQIFDDVHLELAALATVADLVPLTSANRAIVYHGLKKLPLTSRFGLQELYIRAAINTQLIGVYEIGHMIGPRLNAAGRLESAMDSLRLLCTKDRKRAVMLADKLENINGERQLIMRDAITHASGEIRSRRNTKKILIIANDQYEEGIMGLVAGRLVEEYYLPAIVISRGVNTSKGSVRSISGFNIIEFLRSHQEMFINVGGHPMAAGFTLASENIEILQTTLEDNIQGLLTDEQLQKKIKVDLELSFNDVSEELSSCISTLAPFGMGNFEPTFVSRQVLVREKRLLGKERKHMRLVLQGGELGNVIEAVAFGMGDRIGEIEEEGYVDIVYTIGMNEWNGSRRLQIKLKDFKSS